jgi:hypothetical protein
MSEPPSHPAEGLSIAARATFEAIALGQRKRHPVAAITELCRHGLIVGHPAAGWSVPTHLHIAFCEWCATQEPLDV